jgi:hypothetical protein
VSDKDKAAKKDKGADEKGKEKKAKKAKKGGEAAGGMSVAAHPRARAQVRMAKGWGALLAFAVTLYLSLSHGAPADVAGMRAIVAGVCGSVVARGCAVMVWRHLMIAELRARIERAKASLEPPTATE